MTLPSAARDRIAERTAARGEEGRRARALSAVDRILEAGTALAVEQGGASFTVQQVVEAAGVAIQTFYRHFKSKDELVLTIFEEANLAGTIESAQAAETLADPVEKLELLVTRGAVPDAPVAHLTAEIIVREHLRLYESFPDEVERSLLPFRLLLADTIRAAQAQGDFVGLDPDTEAEIIHHLIISRFHLQTLGILTDRRDRVANDLWEFCLGALRRKQNSASPAGAEGRGAKRRPALVKPRPR